MDQNQDQQKPEDKPNEELTSLKTEVESKLTSINEKFDVLQTQLNEVLYKTLNPVVKEEPKEPTEADEEAWWGAFKQTPTKVMKDTVAPLLNDFKEKAKAEVKADILSEVGSKTEAAKYDSMAVREYPQLQDKNHPLYKEYTQVMGEKMKRDPHWNTRPEAVYDTAQIAFARAVAKGDIVPEAFVDEARRMMSVGDGMSPGYQSPSLPNKVTSLNKSQSIWASKLGVKPENYLRRMVHDA